MPDPQDPATRDASVLDWDEADAGHHGRMLQWYAACTGLRRDLLGTGPTRFADVTVAHDEDARWLVTTHTPARGPAHAVAVNLADVPQEVPLVASPSTTVLLAWDDVGTQVREGSVRMPGHAVAVAPPRLSGAVPAGAPSVTIRAHPGSGSQRRRPAD